MLFKRKYDFPGAMVSVSFNGTTRGKFTAGEKETGENVNVFGVDENYLTTSQTEIQKGRGFTSDEISQNKNVAVIGPDVARNLFGKENPVNKFIRYKGYKLRVIGVSKAKGATFGQSQDNFVLLPITLGRKIFSGKWHVYEIRVFVKNPEVYHRAQDRAIVLMRKLRKLKPSQENNFGVVGSEEELKNIEQTTSVLRAAAFIIGLITILASSIALMNIMLVTVAERIREIGVRKAIGASNASIMWQFFMETIFIALIGALLGIFLGIVFGMLIAKLFKVDFVMPWNAIMWGLIITFITAFLSGLYPAYKASKASPIEALRYE